ncbi:hypothetical protein [Helicobacter pylori]|nr:hypothetical protein [Helicobacter pylori]
MVCLKAKIQKNNNQKVKPKTTEPRQKKDLFENMADKRCVNW